MTLSLGEFTAYGSPQLESEFTNWVTTIGESIRRTIGDDYSPTLLVIGGYGRGEGGVEVNQFNGVERPHNNLDLLLIIDGAGRDQLQHRLQPLMDRINRRAPIAVDLSLVTFNQVRRSPPLVLWYDIRHGHKTLFGDPQLLETLRPDDSVRAIAPWDMRNLLTNRATLLLINDHILAHPPSPNRRILIRHAIKAIIGVGDALLYFLGDYHWSYREKRRRMARRQDISPDFQDLYEQASSFRLQPDYRDFQDIDLPYWLGQIRQIIEPIHRQIERFRLGAYFDGWTSYLSLALRRELHRQPTNWRHWARKLRHLARSLRSDLQGLRPALRRDSPSPLHGLAARMAGKPNLLSLLFPVIAYPHVDPGVRHQAQNLLGAPTASADDLRSAYLHDWSQFCDINFKPLLKHIESPREH